MRVPAVGKVVEPRGDPVTHFYDVSLPVHEGMIVYPDNPSPTIRRYASIPRNVTNESTLTLGSHTGTHVDSPLHIRNDAPGVNSLPLESFYGRCKVLDLTDAGDEIRRRDLEGRPLSRGDIVVMKTRNSERGYEAFQKDFAHVKIDAARYLVDAGVRTLGFDYLSVKKFGGDNDVHEMLIDHLTLFEGLDLSGVPAGEYTFLGLPLRLPCDGGPSRVLLLRE